MGPSGDEKRGELLLAEILKGGNFGRHFTKYGAFTHQSMAKKYLSESSNAVFLQIIYHPSRFSSKNRISF